MLAFPVVYNVTDKHHKIRQYDDIYITSETAMVYLPISPLYHTEPRL